CEALAMTTACHSAIRAGQVLSLAEMRELIAQLERCTAPRACAHGRPTMLHLSQEELERQFSRR
ncbi:MAG: DNA mismatch repair protein MutL, partial [Thermomicrobiaceae bacterium]|nr:DNA mismatch repair protein MutL [Thermomicrobiaceae bacterium]